MKDKEAAEAALKGQGLGPGQGVRASRSRPRRTSSESGGRVCPPLCPMTRRRA